ncbi:MAG TPA: hypothetical protein VGB38_00770, partial [bacterium]
MVFTAGLDGLGYGDRVNMRESVLTLGSQTLVRLSGEAIRTPRQMSFRVQASGPPSDLAQIKHSMETLLPESLKTVLSRFTVRGRMNLLDGEVVGDLSGIRFHFASLLGKAVLKNRQPPISIQDINASVLLSGTWEKNLLKNATVSGKFSVDRMDFITGDTATVSFRGASTVFRIDADERGMPRSGSLSGVVAEAFNGRVRFTLEMAAQDGRPFDPKAVLLNGDISADSLDITSFPNMPPGINAAVNGRIRLKAKGSRDIRLSASIGTPGIGYLFQGKPETTQPLFVQVDAFCRARQGFRLLFLDSAFVRSEDLFSARISGNADLSDNDIRFSVNRAVLNHDPLVRLLPKTLLTESLKGLTLSGKETLTLDVRGGGPARRFFTEGKWTMEASGLVLPEQAIGIEGASGEATISGTLPTLRGRGVVRIPFVYLNQVRSIPLENNRVAFAFTVI